MNTNLFHKRSERGFTTVELLIVVALIIVIVGFGLPNYLPMQNSLRMGADRRNIAGLTGQAKLRAAADFTQTRVYANLNGTAFQLQVWNKAGGCWVADSDPTKTCLTYTSGQPSGEVMNLSQGDTFGFGALTAGPTPGQTTIGQAAQCLDNSATAIANTACIVFNSRGIPINATTLAPVANDAFYVTNGTAVSGVTVSAMGSLQTWSIPANASQSNWSAQ